MIYNVNFKINIKYKFIDSLIFFDFIYKNSYFMLFNHSFDKNFSSHCIDYIIIKEIVNIKKIGMSLQVGSYHLHF